MPLKFSITRILTAIGTIAVPVAFFSRMEFAVAIVSVIAGMCFSIMALTAQVADTRPILRITIAAFLGLFVGMILSPAVDPDPYDTIIYCSLGIMFGCIFGLIWNAGKSAEPRSGGHREEPRDPS